MTMAVLTPDMKRVVEEQRLGFHATVGHDGSPNVSPKGTTLVWDDNHLFFADICSPSTTANIRRGSLVEVNVVDPFARRGYRFKGHAVVHDPGTADFDRGIARLREAGSTMVDRVRAIVVIDVEDARTLLSPAYDDGVTEAELRSINGARFERLQKQFESASTAAVAKRQPECLVVKPGQGRNGELAGNAVSFKAGGAATAGRFSLLERVVAPRAPAPPAHVHQDCLAAFYVLSGELDFQLGNEHHLGTTGTFVLVPCGVPHTFRNAGTVDARLLTLHAPANDDDFDGVVSTWSQGERPQPA
jgi:mannose-6-phosphate isomerase-like protein (cupin superfamily)/predicted pyridoxine 5'-phosphate oxidase superfamily flavin-nucleotide-binding protein